MFIPRPAGLPHAPRPTVKSTALASPALHGRLPHSLKRVWGAQPLVLLRTTTELARPDQVFAVAP